MKEVGNLKRKEMSNDDVGKGLLSCLSIYLSLRHFLRQNLNKRDQTLQNRIGTERL